MVLRLSAGSASYVLTSVGRQHTYQDTRGVTQVVSEPVFLRAVLGVAFGEDNVVMLQFGARWYNNAAASNRLKDGLAHYSIGEQSTIRFSVGDSLEPGNSITILHLGRRKVAPHVRARQTAVPQHPAIGL
jgi:hypothetical protein